jgi:cysteinyl-tRNA synthetase
VIAKIRHPEVLRFFLLSSHYRGPMNYSPDLLEQSEAGLTRLYTALRDAPATTNYLPSAATSAFRAAMDDDFNTPEAFAVLQTLARELNRLRDARDISAAAQRATELRTLGAVLGLLGNDPGAWLRRALPAGPRGPGRSDAAAALSDDDIEARISARKAARQDRQWAESDRIRDELAAAGVVLEDKPGGATTWRRK